MKTHIKNLIHDFFSYIASIFTNRAVLVSLGVFFGGALGWSFAGAFRLILLDLFGQATLGYTTLPVSIFALAVIGGIISFLIAQGIVVKRWFRNKNEAAAAAIAALEVPTEPIEVVAESEPVNLSPLSFDPKAGILSYHGQACEIPFKTYQHAICAKLFERPGERMEEWQILSAVDSERDRADSERLVKDAVYAVNAKAKIALGIEKALVWEKLTAWVNDIYLA